ncbi:MAG: adenylosuccinate lyase [Planctomycetota bacterium]
MSNARPQDQYESPLVTRNASPEMLRLLGASHKIGLWRRLWLKLAEGEKRLGIDRITDDALAQMEASLNDIDFARAAEHEKRLRHDVMAHVHTFEEAAPAAKGIIHLGATSQYVVDNAELIVMREALRLLATKLARAVDAMGTFAIEWKDLPTLGYTHFQPAQLTTVGKRATLWTQDVADDVVELERLADTLRFRGVKGTTGTQASFLALFDGDGDKVDQLDDFVREAFGFETCYAVSGQTYPRKLDATVAGVLSGVAASIHKFANDIRILAGLKQLEEPFEKDQIVSSAMAYKRNPMRCERATGLCRFAMSLATSPVMTAAEQWLERTLDDSSNKRLALPEMFLALDAAADIVTNVSRGLVVYPAVVAKTVAAELPFMATEEILMAGVKAGGDRQELHEAVRKHSMDAAANVKQRGGDNDLIDRLRGDPLFAKVDLDASLDPARFTGRAAVQTERFVSGVVEPIRERYRDQLAGDVELKV